MTLSCRSWASFVFLTAVLALYNMMLGLGLAFPVEIIAMHMLLSQWNVAVAIVVTLLSVYVAVGPET